MSTIFEKNCPYEDWTSEARIHCSNPEHFHCLKDDYERTVWLCAEPIWVNKGHCPEYNTGSGLLDVTVCTQSRCPQQDYRSNAIDIEYACRYIAKKESSTMIFTTTSSETNKNSIGVLISLTVLTFITILVLVAGTLLYKYRRRSLNNGTQQEESVHFTQETATETPYTVKGPTKSFDQAKNLLIQKRMVVITGVQGSGKTFLAKSLVNDMQKNGKIKNDILICSLTQLRLGPSEKIDMYIIDDIFYELQLYENFKETLEILNVFLSNTEKAHLIITIPSYTWVNHCYEFDTMFDRVLVDLDKREEREKLTILHSIKAQYDFTNEQSEKLIELQNDLMVTSSECIGFPALVSWICKQPSVEKIEKCFNHPLHTMKDDISSIRKAKSLEKRGRFLVLSYMCLNDGKMIAKNVDRKIFDSLKQRYAPKFEDKNLTEFCEGMVGYYLIKKEGLYEFDLNIMKKIVFVCLAKKSASHVQRYCKYDYSKHVVKDNRCPRDMEIWYTECFTRI